MTQIFQKNLFPDTSAECIKCTGVEEDCFHLYFECHFAKAMWGVQKIPWVGISSGEAFWGLLRVGASKTVTEQGRLFAIIQAIWPH